MNWFKRLFKKKKANIYLNKTNQKGYLGSETKECTDNVITNIILLNAIDNSQREEYIPIQQSQPIEDYPSNDYNYNEDSSSNNCDTSNDCSCDCSSGD